MIIISLVVASLEILNLVITASIVAIMMVGLGVVTQQEARDSVQWDLFIVIASAFGISNAMEMSGFASLVASGIVAVGDGLGIGGMFFFAGRCLYVTVLYGLHFVQPQLTHCAKHLPIITFFAFAVAGAYGSVYFATSFLSSILTNNAAAALMYPIAMDAVALTGADRMKMAFAVMLAASDYMTSFGYQTNLMVFSAGGYRNVDFLRFGTPLQIIIWLSGTAILSLPDNIWYISWIVAALCLVLACLVRMMTCLQGKKKN
jgi:di/tricarboxylate transporter